MGIGDNQVGETINPFNAADIANHYWDDVKKCWVPYATT